MQLSNFKGVNNSANANRLPDGYLREIVDFSVDNSGLLSQRGGYSQKSGAVFNCVWSDGLRCFAVKDGDLVEVIDSDDGTYSFTVLRADIGYRSLSFCELNGNYYYLNDIVTGVIDASGSRSFGLPMVNYQPTVTEVIGTMAAGVYLVAVTAIDSSGRESGTKEPASITLMTGKALSLENIYVSTDPRVTHIAVYVSDVNGSELFRQKLVTNGATTTTVTSVSIHKFPLGKIGLEPAPTGQLIAYHYGRFYIADDTAIYYSNPEPACEQLDNLKGFDYPSNVTMILPCDSGMWVSTEKHGLFWLAGKTPFHNMEVKGDMMQTRKSLACMHRGSEKRVEAHILKQGSHGFIATADDGIYLLLDGGQFTNVTWDNIKIPKFTGCAGAIISDDDAYRYLAIINGATVPVRTI